LKNWLETTIIKNESTEKNNIILFLIFHPLISC